MSVLPGRARRTLLALAALAGLMLTTGQSCAAASGAGSSHSVKDSNSRHDGSSKKQKYDDDGYDQYGYNQAGYDRDGYNRNGYDENGYDEDGYDRNGYDHNNRNRYGYDRKGFDESGCNRAGYDTDGDTCDSDGGSKHKHEDKDDDS